MEHLKIIEEIIKQKNNLKQRKKQRLSTCNQTTLVKNQTTIITTQKPKIRYNQIYLKSSKGSILIVANTFKLSIKTEIITCHFENHKIVNLNHLLRVQKSVKLLSKFFNKQIYLALFQFILDLLIFIRAFIIIYQFAFPKTNFSSKEMIQENTPNKYPYYPPFDEDVDFNEGAQLKLDPQNQDKTVKFCPICNIPIHIRIISKPCNHYFCYACYQKNKYECGFCGSLNSKIERISDKQTFLSCDNQCYKVFQTQQQFQKHMRDHQLIKKS